MVDALSQQIVNIYSADYKLFFSKPNVTGIAYGYKVTNGINTCEPSIHVFVEKKVSANCLPKDGIIPPLYKGIKTDVIESGQFLAGDNSQLLNNDCSSINFNLIPGYKGRVRPIQPSWIMGSYNDRNTGSGTFSYIVLDKSGISQTYCLLSVNKTFANFNEHPIGGFILQPPVLYEGKYPEDIVGKLLRFHPLKFKQIPDPPPPISEMNIIDASVASLYSPKLPQLINPFIPPNNIIPTGLTSPSIGQKVQWTGCSLGYSTGVVNSIEGILKVSYRRDLVCWFKNAIVTSGLSSLIDDGALVLDDDRKALGLLFGSAYSLGNLVCRITDIEELLNIKLVTL